MWITLATVSFWLLATQHALAYLDPGTGSIVLQGIIAALSTVLVSIALGWRYITDRKFKPSSTCRVQPLGPHSSGTNSR